MNCGVCVSGTINCLAIRYEFPLDCDYGSEWPFMTIDQFVIILLDLITETYHQLLPPRGFDNVPPMKEFEVEESWTQFLKISYESLPIDYDAVRGFVLFPLCLSEDGDALILVWDEAEQAIFYNLRANIGEKAKTTKEIQWFGANEYVESLVSTN
ncbi:hypothetical protein MtrunA17_Chr7g0235661 [Medicago truncatula]|nr:hypothetical protein MtrunA17_Chr7g0235661 [Medicago truncatula]